ncbi:MAG: SRPBCC family protein [Rhodospirillales bacterium]
MKIDNSLILPLPPEDAWRILLDIPFVAPCLPGTELTKVVDERTFEGTVKLKLGPVSLSFRGEASVEDVDPDACAVRVSAKGREERGRGTAHADVTFCLVPEAGGTRVDVVTDLNLAGSIIQYARGAGMIERTAQSLVDQFAQRLSARIESGETPDAEAIKVGSLLWHGIKSGIGGGKDNGREGDE